MQFFVWLFQNFATAFQEPGLRKHRKNMEDTRWKVGFFTANFVHNFAVKCGEITKSHHIPTLTTSYRPYTDSILSPPDWQSLFLPLRHYSMLSSIFVLKLNQNNSPLYKTYALNFCKISSEITNFSGEMWWMRYKYVSSKLTLVVKLHKITA